MKYSGIIRGTDIHGRIVIPKPIRDYFALDKTTPIQIFVDEDTVILKKLNMGCCFCGEMRNTLTHNNTLVCYDCITSLYQSYAERV